MLNPDQESRGVCFDKFANLSQQPFGGVRHKQLPIAELHIDIGCQPRQPEVMHELAIPVVNRGRPRSCPINANDPSGYVAKDGLRWWKSLWFVLLSSRSFCAQRIRMTTADLKPQPLQQKIFLIPTLARNARGQDLVVGDLCLQQVGQSARGLRNQDPRPSNPQGPRSSASRRE
jgi:hypothetical protein